MVAKNQAVGLMQLLCESLQNGAIEYTKKLKLAKLNQSFLMLYAMTDPRENDVYKLVWGLPE